MQSILSLGSFLESSRQFSKNNTKFNECLSSASLTVPCERRTDTRTDGRMDRRTYRQKDMTKAAVPSRNFSNALDKNQIRNICRYLLRTDLPVETTESH